MEEVSYLRAGQNVIGWLAGLVGTLPGGLDLYQALRRPEARNREMSRVQQLTSIAAGVLLVPFAILGTAVEVAARRGGNVYVQARLD